MATRATKRRIPAEIEDTIENLADQGYSTSQIFGVLTEKFPHVCPTLRTVQRVVKAALPRDTSGPWSLGEGDPDDAPIVLKVLAKLNRELPGVRVVSCAEARILARLHRAVPDLPPSALHTLSLQYVKRQEGLAPTTDLDLFLAFAPWRSQKARKSYENAIARGMPPLEEERVGRVVQIEVLEAWAEDMGILEEEASLNAGVSQQEKGEKE